MKKMILILAAAAVLAACNNQKQSGSTSGVEKVNKAVTEVADPENAPIFKFEKDSYDFGQITQGESVTYDFKFENVGKSPLIISDAAASCGCTKPEYPTTPIAPGQEGLIHVVFNSAGKEGMQNKVVTLTSNAVPSTTQLHLIGDVKPAKTK